MKPCSYSDTCTTTVTITQHHNYRQSYFY